MKLGIKVGLQPTSFEDLNATKPDMAEVWFDINRKDEYAKLFDKLTSMHIDVGLHFWGVLPDTTWTNISYPDVSLNAQSLELMYETIDVAAEHHFSYVNIHPTPRAKVLLNLQTYDFTVNSEPVGLDIAVNTFLSNVTMLNAYAKEKNVVLTVETVPPKVKIHNDPNHTLELFELPPDALIMAMERGICIANDFAHTTANCASDNPQELWTYLQDTSKRMLSHTRLLHISYVMRPHHGSDCHESLDHPKMATDEIVPNSMQMIELLKLYKNRDDIWALVEPTVDHVKNYFLAKTLLKFADQ